MKLLDTHLLRTILASFWSYSGRFVGLAWTAVLIKYLGIGAYGTYSVAMAAAAIINAGIDNAFYVRSLRLDEDRYKRERAARSMFGVVVAAVGVLVYLEFYVAGFAIIVAAGELLFNTYKSRLVRGGRPDITMRYDSLRQITSIGLATSYLVLAETPSLFAASALYLLPYAVIVAITITYVPRYKPAFPGGRKEFLLLSSEAFAAALYQQGDVLIIGWVAGETIAGFYSVALVTAVALSMIGQNYANTFIERIRDAQGHSSGAPSLRSVFAVSAVTGATMAAIGGGILVWGGADYVGHIALILAPFVFIRSINYTFIVILFVQKRDALRVRATVSVAVVKIAAVLATVSVMGGYGAAITCVISEFVLFVVYYRAIYRTGFVVPPAEPGLETRPVTG